MFNSLLLVTTFGATAVALDNLYYGHKISKSLAEEAEDETEVVEDKSSTENAKPADAGKAITVDSEKLKGILVAANYPADRVGDLVTYIEKNAAAEKPAEVILDNTPRSPIFTIIKEEPNKKEDK